ncbi:MAG: MarR family transcriptional regulator [Candidatus Anstonellaceae archaeon]
MEFQKNKPLLAVIGVLLVLLVAAVFFYNRTLNELAIGSCTDANGPSCPHAKVVETQNLVIAVLIVAIALLGGWLLYHSHWKKGKQGSDEELVETATHKEHLHTPTRKVDLSSLDSDEKKVIAIVQEQGGSTFQSEIIKQTNYSKVKISRVLDKLEQKGLIERKRRGMTNLVVIK